MYASFPAATAQIELHCVERVFGDKNKQGIVVSSSAMYESMQFYFLNIAKRMQCPHFHQQFCIVQWTVCALDVTHVYKPKETIPIVFFTYGELKPNIN
jgi:hypothetical protein